jgi:pimeloyl-ACP methyl ester carboxylesterase
MASERPVVLLHAFPLNATLWRPQVEAWPVGWRVVTPDLPGFGASSEPPTATMDDMARGILRILDGLGIQRAVIGGLSMGGYLTLALYRLAPERFSGMILADTRATPDTEEQKAGRRKMIATVREQGPPAIADEMLPKLLGATSQRERPSLSGTVRAMIEGNRADAIAGAVEAIMGRPDSTPLLPSIAVPALVLCGDEDVLTPPSDSEALHRWIPGSRLVMLPRAGHLSNIEVPELFSRALHEFLAAIPSNPR